MAVVDQVTVRSRFLPPITIPVGEGDSGILQSAQATFELRGDLGSYNIAQYGVPDPDAWKRNLAIAFGAVLLVLVVANAIS